MNEYYFSECGNFKLQKNTQSGYSGGQIVFAYCTYWKYSVGTQRVKKIDETEFRNLKGTNKVDIMAYF